MNPSEGPSGCVLNMLRLCFGSVLGSIAEDVADLASGASVVASDSDCGIVVRLVVQKMRLGGGLLCTTLSNRICLESGCNHEKYENFDRLLCKY